MRTGSRPGPSISFQRRRQTLAGLLADQDRKETLALHHNAQRLLRPLLVANPFAESLTFLDDKTRTRRDHLKYLTLIRAIALLHQYQRPVKTIVHHERKRRVHRSHAGRHRRGEPTGVRSAGPIGGRTAAADPPAADPRGRMVTAACKRQAMDRADYRFSRRDVREFTGWGHTQLKVHLKRLEELEYLLIHRGGRGQSFVYELLYEPSPDAGQPVPCPADRRGPSCGSSTTATCRGQTGRSRGSGRGQVGVKSGRSRRRKSTQVPMGQAVCRPRTPK